MNLSALQSWIAARITAVPALAAFGEPLLYSPFASEVAARTTIDTRLRTDGACIEIGRGDFDRVGSRSVRGTAVRVDFEVYLAESIATAHAPFDQELVEAVVAAIEADSDAREPAAELESGETAITEGGYVLHVLTFSKNVTIP